MVKPAGVRHRTVVCVAEARLFEAVVAVIAPAAFRYGQGK